MKLVKKAKELHQKIQECDQKILEAKQELAGATKQKQDLLIKDITQDTSELNNRIVSLKQDISDYEDVKGLHTRNLFEAAGQIKQERLREQQTKLNDLKVEKVKIGKKIEKYNNSVLKLENKIVPVMTVNGVMPTPEKGRLNDSIMEVEGQIGLLKELKEEQILTELDISIKQKVQQPAKEMKVVA